MYEPAGRDLGVAPFYYIFSSSSTTLRLSELLIWTISFGLTPYCYFFLIGLGRRWGSSEVESSSLLPSVPGPVQQKSEENKLHIIIIINKLFFLQGRLKKLTYFPNAKVNYFI